jgi:tRNA threonylcarbamoyl adenosine modification protein YeaZ
MNQTATKAIYQLALDTSGPACSVAVWNMQSGSLTGKWLQPMERGHAEALTVMVEQCLEESEIGFEQIGRVVVCTGPGSFAGLRVGLAAAKGYGLALDIPVIGISSFDCFEAEARSAGATSVIAVVMDGRRGEVFSRQEEGEAVRKPLEELSPRDFDGVSTLVGPFAEQVAARIAWPPEKIMAMDALVPVERLALLGSAASPTSNGPSLQYIRGADAKPGAGFTVELARDTSTPPGPDSHGH